jgi:hypothetical protein
MKKTMHPGMIFILLVLYPIVGWAQENHPELYRIITHDRNEFVGTILEETETEIVLRTAQYGDIRMARSDIFRMTAIRQETLIEGVHWPDNPQSSRYFWAPNGYGLKEGEVYYQNIWVLYNQISVGVTENVSFSAGMLPLFLFSAGVTPVWLVPKVSIPLSSDRVQLGAGAFLGALLGENEVFGIVFATTTIGSRDRNTNIGLGWGFAGSEWARHPIINVGFMARTGPRGYFLSENYLFPGKDTVVMLSAGGRRIVGNGLGLDFGLFLPLNTGDDFIAIPFLGITVPLNKG